MARENKMLEEDIEKLGLNEKINQILITNNILKVKELSNKTKTKLKSIGLVRNQISEVEVRLQLTGLDLKGNY